MNIFLQTLCFLLHSTICRCAHKILVHLPSRLGNDFTKVQWISTGTEKFAVARNRGDLSHKTVAELREFDPWKPRYICSSAYSWFSRLILSVVLPVSMPKTPISVCTLIVTYHIALCMCIATVLFCFYSRDSAHALPKCVDSLLCRPQIWCDLLWCVRC